MCGDGFIVEPDGILTRCAADDTDSFPPQNLHPDGEPLHFAVYDDASEAMGEERFAMELYDEAERVSRYLLSFEREAGKSGVLLTRGEAGGFYERY